MGHADHARGGHGEVWATPETLAIMAARYGPQNGHGIDKLLTALRANPARCVLVGAYALGKAQRVIRELRVIGFEDPIYLHGALQLLCDLYVELGIDLGDLRPATGVAKRALEGRIILCLPGALNDRWSRRLPDPITAMASGWMRVRQRARQRNVELPRSCPTMPIGRN